jgi:hypothetical protein
MSLITALLRNSGLKLLNSTWPILCLSPYTTKVLCIKQSDNFLMKRCAWEIQQKTLFRRLAVGFKLLMIKLLIFFHIHKAMKPLPRESFGNYLKNSCAMNMSPLFTLNAALHSYGEIIALFQKYRRHYSIDVNSSTLGNCNMTQSFQPHYGPGVDSASNRNEYQGIKGGRTACKAGNLTAFQPHYCPGADSAANRNDLQESSWRGRTACKAGNLTAFCEPTV